VKRNNVIKGKKGQQLNQREIGLINSGVAEGLLLIDVKPRNNSVTLTYNTDGLISLHDFLYLNEMTRRLFVVTMRSIALALKAVEENKFSKNLIVWDIYTSYIDPVSWRVYLMYVPLQPYEISGSLKTYLQAIVSACNFASGEDVGYVQELVREMNAGVAYTGYMLEAYCDKISEELFSENAKRYDVVLCPVCNAKLMSEEISCPYCGAAIKKKAVNGIMGGDCLRSAPPPCLNAEDSREAFIEKQSGSRQGELSVNEDENGVVTVFRSSRSNAQTVWLEHRKQMGKISVTRFPFRIGKMEGVTDYRICSNNVSRKHADILKEQGRYFVVDLGSTNGTYLDGKRLQPGVKEQLVDGAFIRFADTEFKFHID
jgi:rubrerythrin